MQWIGYVAGLIAVAVAVVALITRYIPSVVRPVLVTAALAPYLMLGAPMAVVLFGALRCWVLAAIAGVVTVAVAAVQAPRYVGGKSEAAAASVRLVSANLRYGRADPDALVRLAQRHADILAVQELTHELTDRLAAAGIGDAFPHYVLRAREGPDGVGIWSRYPMQRGAEYDEFWLGLLTARVQLPRFSGEATVVVTHMSAPWPDPLRGWRDDLARLGETLQQIGDSAPGPVMVAGDLNATPDVLEFRRLLRDGYRDAAEQAGAGLTRTHPDDVRLLPPIFAVDHVLTRDCSAKSVRTLEIPGSDHRALATVITLPTADTSVRSTSGRPPRATFLRWRPRKIS
jgi:endonuclease/exonuclease/phosphatase (EEP) superfamily protein YafD